jgi:hypothetical protein
VDAVKVHSIRNGNQFQIVRRKDFPFRVVYLHSKGFSGAFVQNLKTFLAAGEEIIFSPLTQSNDGRELVIAGHKRVGNEDSPRIIGETRKYIRDFERLAMQTTTARELYDEMLKLYPDWINRGALWTSVRAVKT